MFFLRVGRGRERVEVEVERGGGRERGKERGGETPTPTTLSTKKTHFSFSFSFLSSPSLFPKTKKTNPGGYECVSDIKDECAADHGGCWRKEYTIRGKRTLVSACHDRLPEFKDAAAHGRLTPDFKLSECRCPPCFTEFEQNGRTECVPKCDLDSCEERTGVCSAGGGGARGGRGSAATIWASAGVAFVALAAVAAGGYVAYRARIRAAMAAEVRSILSQYMELPSDAGSGGGGGGAGAGGANGSNGFARGTIDDTGF